MKIKELMMELEKVLKDKGDIEVTLTNNHEYARGDLKLESLDYDEYNDKITLCD